MSIVVREEQLMAALSEFFNIRLPSLVRLNEMTTSHCARCLTRPSRPRSTGVDPVRDVIGADLLEVAGAELLGRSKPLSGEHKNGTSGLPGVPHRSPQRTDTDIPDLLAAQHVSVVEGTSRNAVVSVMSFLSWSPSGRERPSRGCTAIGANSDPASHHATHE